MKTIFLIAACLISLLGKGQAAFVVPKTGGSGGVVQTYIHVNIYDSARGNVGKSTDPKYNNWAAVAAGSVGLTSAPLLDTNGVNTGVTATIGNLNDNAVSSAGYGSANTIGYPTIIFLDCFFGNSTLTITLSHIPAGKTPVVKFIGSTNNSGAGTSYPETLTSGAYSSGSFDSFNNTTILKTTTALTPSSGTVILTLTGTFCVATAFDIIY